MQKLSVKFEFLCFITVNGVADDRMPDIFAVYPYLVRSSGFKAETHKRVRRVSLYDFVIGYRYAPLVGNCHHGAVFVRSAYVSFYFAIVGLYRAFDKCVIYPRAGLVLYLFRQRQVRRVVFRDDQKTRSVFVYPVDYSRADYAVYAA